MRQMVSIRGLWIKSIHERSLRGTTKFHHIEGAAKAVELELTEDEIRYLEEPYVPHALVGVMAQNRPERTKEMK